MSGIFDPTRSISLALDGWKGSKGMTEIKRDYKIYHKTPIGFLEIRGSERGISHVSFAGTAPHPEERIPACLRKCVRQLEEYFTGKRTSFSLHLNVEGTKFQKRVWNELARIPFGKTVSYKEVALSLGNKKATRAVGGATGKNPVAVIIPCHRVIAHDGTLGGFGGGLWKKVWLLNHEKTK